MEGFNKIISFILGLIVVIVVFALVTKKINLSKLGGVTKTTTTTTEKISPTPISTVKINSNTNPPTTNNYNNYKTTSPSSIPSTGLPTLFIPSLLAAASGGVFLRKTGKK